MTVPKIPAALSTRIALLAALVLYPSTVAAAETSKDASEESRAREILEATSANGGLIVHVGCGDGRFTAALGAGDGFLVHGLDANADNVGAAQRHVQSLGLYGKVSIDRFAGGALPYTDNLVNLVVAEEPGAVETEEVMRVLCPGGVAYVKQENTWTKTVKPWPEGLDQWTHSLYAADNNAVGQDSAVGPPHHLQWVGEPESARQHERLGSVSVMVSAGGRVFSIQDEGPISSILLPARWFLVARDAFNGVILWKRPIGPWETYLRSFRSGPPDLSRRLVAVGDRVYVTLGYGKPVSVLDAATGEIIETHEGTEGTTEILHHDGVLFLVVGEITAEEAAAAAKRRAPSPAAGNRRILAVEADTGKILWSKADREVAGVMPTTLAVAGSRVFFQNPEAVVCLDSASGEPLWRSARRVSTTRPPWSAPTLVAYKDVVLSADRAAPAVIKKEPERVHRTNWVNAPLGELIAFSAETGERLWSCPARECFNAPVDVLVADGLVWTGELVVAGEPGITAGRDPMTGEIKRRRPADQAFFNVGMPHHRCYRNRATGKYLVLGRAGVEFIDLASGQGIPHHWIRGTCQFGVVPCNGLLYVPPHSCACYIQAKLNGFLALAPQWEERGEKSEEGGSGSRLERGPAYHAVRGSPDPAYGTDQRSPSEQPGRRPVRATAGPGDSRRAQLPHPSSLIPHPSEDWPTYRHDAARSGRAGTAVPAELKSVWSSDVGGRLSALTIADGKVFVASIDRHTVYALDAATGKVVWQYTAGGRVDSPPTLNVGRISNPSGGTDGLTIRPTKSDGLEIRPTGLCVFGCRDGSVYCLRASDGKLVWRFRAAPADRRVVAYGQLESTWPVHGNVLIQNGEVWFAAGRSSYLDGGIYLYRLDLGTGKVLSETPISSRDPKSGQQPKGVVESFDLPGALPDVLSSDGELVFMRHVAFDRQGIRQTESRPHLYSPAGFLDDTWWHRSYWIFGQRFYTGYRDWFRAGREVPGGRILVVDESSVYGFARKADYYYWSTPLEYHLCAADKEPKIVDSPKKSPRAPAWGQRQIRYRWSRDVPFLARAMVLAGETIFLAGPPDLLDEQQAFKAFVEPSTQAKLAEQTAALHGDRGAMLWAVAADDGRKLAEHKLQSPPVFDGMAAAGGRLYLATVAGKVVCLGKGPGQ